MKYAPLTIGLSFVLASSPALFAQEAKQTKFTQVPEIVESQVAGSPAETKPEPKVDPKQGPAPSWIWGAKDGVNYTFRKSFETAAKKGKLRVAADNHAEVSLNGKQVAVSTTWESPTEVDLASHLKAGANEVVIKAKNEGGLAGLICRLALIDDAGKTEYILSDASWTASEKADGAGVAAKVVAKFGAEPWGEGFLGGAAPGGGNANRGLFQLAEGFQVERLFTVPKDQLGSWVCITFDHKGRLLASDQGKEGLCRITLPAPGSKEPVQVERLDLKITAAQGMLYAFNALYLSVNGGPGSGLYRARDTNGDDQYDELTKLADFKGGGEHGPHGLVLSPDGKSIVVTCGNHTQPPAKIDHSRIPTNWQEDHLLPRQWDANGHARGVLAPGGWIAQTDPEGKTWEVLSMGYRNQYDISFNQHGDLFSYDADMEWDFGTPWYRPTRVNHAVSGSELGWRSGTGKWPAYYLDSLPAAVDIGPGSPVGITFGTGTKFPAKYQKALFICDWTFGTMYAIHFKSEGATYIGEKQEFVARTPLPLTDNAVGPDGALYFTVGGRGTQSELFRVTYVGKESTAPVKASDVQLGALHQLRRSIEEYHKAGADLSKAIDVCYPHLSHDDRFIRYAARVALERVPVAQWQEKVLAEKNIDAVLTGIVGLAHQGEASLQPKLIAKLESLEFAALSERQQLDYCRAFSLVFTRLGAPDAETSARLAKKLEGIFPGKNRLVARESAGLLIYLQSPTIGGRVIAEMRKDDGSDSNLELGELLSRNAGYGGTVAKVLANQVDLQKFQYAFILRNLKAGWTLEDRKFFFAWLNEARTKSGGASFQGFINNLEKDAFDNCTDNERLAVEALGLKKPFVVKDLPKPQGPGKAYTLEEIVAASAEKMKGRNFENGKKMFAAARCVVCHRYNGEGGATGPDLTQVAGRFSLKDMAEAIIDPNKVISDQYKASVVETTNGKLYTGKIVSETNEAITLVINPEDSTKTVELKKSDIETNTPSPVSLMPKDLLSQLNENEAFDLLAYLLSRGEKDHPAFKK